MKKRSLSLLLALTMIVSVFNFIVQADEGYDVSSYSDGTVTAYWDADTQTLDIVATGSSNVFGTVEVDMQKIKDLYSTGKISKIKTLNFHEGITNIGGLEGNEAITSVESLGLPNSLKRIDSYAFYGIGSEVYSTVGSWQYNNERTLIIPANVESINEYAFSNSYMFDKIVFLCGADNRINIENNAFDNVREVECVRDNGISEGFREMGVNVNNNFSIWNIPSNYTYGYLNGFNVDVDGNGVLRINADSNGNGVIPTFSSDSDIPWRNASGVSTFYFEEGITDLGDFNKGTENYCGYGEPFVEEYVTVYADKTFESVIRAAYPKAKIELQDYSVKSWDISKGYGSSVTATFDTNTGEFRISGTGRVSSYYVLPWEVYKKEITTVIIENGITSIENEYFKDCTSLSSVTLGDTLESIGRYAFEGCTSLQEINIPTSVTNIDTLAFGECGSLIITVKDSNSKYSADDGVLFNKDKTELVAYTKDKIKSEYKIPDSVTKIGESAFNCCRNLKEITIPSSVTEIGMLAFNGCWLLQEIVIPDSVTTIGVSAFSLCNALENINIPNNMELTKIYDSTFEQCPSLKTITIPANITSIGNSAFGRCENIKEFIYLGSNLTFEDNSFGNSFTDLIDYSMGSAVEEGKVQKYLPEYVDSNSELISKLTELGYEMKTISDDEEEETPTEPDEPTDSTDRVTTPDHTNIIVEVETTNFKVVVPIKVDISFDNKGVATIADSYTVNNQCALGPVIIEGIEVVTVDTWSLKDYSTFDFKNTKAGEKYLGLTINDAVVGENGSVTLNSSLSSVIRNKESKALSFDAKIPAQKTAINSEVASGIVFTVDFDKI